MALSSSGPGYSYSVVSVCVTTTDHITLVGGAPTDAVALKRNGIARFIGLCINRVAALGQGRETDRAGDRRRAAIAVDAELERVALTAAGTNADEVCT